MRRGLCDGGGKRGNSLVARRRRSPRRSLVEHDPLGYVPILFSIIALAAGQGGAGRPADDRELRARLENMVWYHRYTTDEIRAATGLESEAIIAALKRFDI